MADPSFRLEVRLEELESSPLKRKLWESGMVRTHGVVFHHLTEVAVPVDGLE